MNHANHDGIPVDSRPLGEALPWERTYPSAPHRGRHPEAAAALLVRAGRALGHQEGECRWVCAEPLQGGRIWPNALKFSILFGSKSVVLELYVRRW